ncbi:MAG TPA: hypothetical protein VKT71_00445 [Candidatus Acidoferrales bacterium]|nr:hypothetical protein [Candidatus Acidoferrales bacterium]
MSNGPQTASVTALEPRVFDQKLDPKFESTFETKFESKFETNSSIAVHRGICSPSVLLVGRNGSWGATVLKSLAKFGSKTSFVAQDAVTPRVVIQGAFDVVLLDSTVSPDQRRRLASELAGSATSVFYTFPVENGCWWLPALRRGQDCHGDPAFRRNEFVDELERMLKIDAQA